MIIHAGTCLSQPLLWTCPTSSDNKPSHFPNISFDDDSLANSVRGSPYLSGLYVYRFQPLINSSCNTIPLIEFCYGISEIDTKKNNKSIDIAILLGSIDNIEPSGTSFTGRVFIQETIESTVNCNIKKAMNDSVCCQSVRIDITLSTQLLQQINALGVEFPNQILLEYGNDSQNNIVETFVGTSLDFRGFGSTGDQEPVLMLQVNGSFMDLGLRYLRLVIEESPNPQNTNTTLSSLALAIVLPIVGGLIIIFLSIIAVLIFTIWWRKREKVIISKDPQKAFDNANC